MDYVHPEVLVDAAWLAAHLDDPALRVIEVSEDPVAYEAGHIPGAVFWDVYQTILRPDLHTQDDPAAVAALFGAAGLTPATTVILAGAWGMTPWGFWFLRLWGHTAARVLDGGRAAWDAAGYPLTREPSAPTPTTYPLPTLDPTLRADLATVRTALGQPGSVVVDVRSPGEYRGEWFVTGPPDAAAGERGGHMPGAVYLFFREAVHENGLLRPTAALQALYEAHGVTPDRAVLLYCMVGMRAAHTWFVLTYLLGYPRVRPYDLSWNEWGRQPDTPVEA